MRARSLANLLAAASLAVALCLATPCRAADAVADRVRRVIGARMPDGARLGVSIRDTETGQELYAYHSQTLVRLASNTKLFTIAAALSSLGEDYEFKTRLVADGPVSDGVLRGSLFVVGGGDPNISGRFHGGDSLAVLRAWTERVKAAGVERIDGSVVVDDSFFDSQRVAPGWPRDQLSFWYAAPIGALSFEDNCVAMSATGAARAGEPASVRVRPAFDGIEIDNRTRTVAPNSRSSLVFSTRGALTFVATGVLRSGETQSRYVTVGDPALYLGHALSHALRSGGVDVGGGVRRARGGEKTDGETLAVWTSPLLESCAIANKRSQNFYAEQILKTMGAEQFQRGTFTDGVRAIARFHRSVGIPPRRVYLYDGSGLSSKNRAWPSTVSWLLKIMAEGELGEAYRKTLAVSGVDGTLRNRLNKGKAKGRVFAKTGTLSSVSALSGYADAPDGSRYAFAILCDGIKPGQTRAARQLQDAICRTLLSD